TSTSDTLSLSVSGSLSQDGTTISNTLITTNASTLSTSTSAKGRSTSGSTIRCVDYNLNSGSLTCYFIIYTANISGATSGCLHLYYSSAENSQLQSIAKFQNVTVGNEITLFHEEEIPSGASGFTVYSCNGSSESLLTSASLTDYSGSDGIMTDSDGNYTVSVEAGKYHTLSIRRPTKDLGDITIDLSSVTTEEGLNEIKNDSSKLSIGVPSGFTNILSINGPVTSSSSTASTGTSATTVATVDFTTFSTEIGKDSNLTASTTTTTTYSVGGTIKGLGGTVVLQNNGGDNLTLSSEGNFSFPTSLADGSAYSVTVLTQPSTPSQTCTVTSGTGTITTANVSNVAIVCNLNWTQRASLPTSASWDSVAFGNNTFVAVSFSTSNVAAYSTDNGVTWTASTLPASQNWSSIAYGNGKFIAVANSSSTAAVSSDNGASWSTKTLPSTSDWNVVGFGNNTFVVAAYSSTAAAYSTDNGNTWTATTVSQTGSWTGIVYGNSKFVLAGHGGTSYSTDGITWNNGTIDTTGGIFGLAFGNGTFVTIAGSGTLAQTSSDGITWTQRTLPTSTNWNSLMYGNNLFVALSYNTTITATSTDGITWTQGTLPLAGEHFEDLSAFGNGVHLFIGRNTTNVFTSP
ncbi:MAG: hypothetical protein AAF518_02310, partial [Spirochaetota bacterium]